jgi:carboxypeptidase family protein
VARASLSSLQSVVGLVAGLSSIGGGLYSAVRFFTPGEGVGEVVAVVREVRTAKPVPDATVDILTPSDALVTNLSPADDGRARYALPAGPYHVRVSHPRFDAETREIQVLPGQTAEVRFQLTQRTALASTAHRAPLARAVDRGMSTTRRLLRGLGL